MNYIPLFNPVDNSLWRIKLDPVFRLLNKKEWLDNFFNKGELLLSCFNSFRKNQDEFQGDSREGEALGYFVTGTGATVGLKYQSGFNALVMSTTTEYNEKIISDFNSVGAIRIINTTEFATGIANCLTKFRSGVEGHCIYSHSRVFRLNDDPRLQELYKNPDAEHRQAFMEEFQLLCLDRELFLKHNKYKYQKEYRFVWIVEDPIHESIVIRCPELIPLCERIDF
jgi:hypothetical protein